MPRSLNKYLYVKPNNSSGYCRLIPVTAALPSTLLNMTLFSLPIITPAPNCSRVSTSVSAISSEISYKRLRLYSSARMIPLTDFSST